MKIYEYLDISKVFVVGDIHGEFKEFFNAIKRLGLTYNKEEYKEEVHPLIKEENELNNENLFFHKKKINTNIFHDSLIFVCGDCGFGFNKSQYYFDILEKNNKLFSETNTHIIFVRGNHDDPSYFNGEMINLTNIKAIPDYSVVLTSIFSTLCVGGAISVDRIWRKQQEIRINKYRPSATKKLYWENEAPIINGKFFEELKEYEIKIDSVITHTAPSFVFPFQKDTALSWFKIDPTLKDDVDNERKTMDWLYEQLVKEHTIKFWSYGHFHQSVEDFKNGTAFICNTDSVDAIKDPNISYIRLNERDKNDKKRRKKRKNSESQVMDNLLCIDDTSNVEDINEMLLGEEVQPIRVDFDFQPLYHDINEVEVDEAPF